MNIIKERRKCGAVCPRCKHPDYTAHPPVKGETIKPEFKCKACDNIWAYGYDGGMYAKLAIKWENDSLGYIGSIGISRPMNQDEARIINDFVRSKSVLLATKKLVGDLERNDRK